VYSAYEILRKVADEFEHVVPEVDSRAEHDRWKPGIGPFEEDEQLRMLVESSRNSFGGNLRREVDYHETEQSCDLVYESGEQHLPIEAKLIRFRYDNGNIDPNTFSKVFSPFPERGSSSLLTDAKKLYESDFDGDFGLLGIYYEKGNEEYEHMMAEKLVEKLSVDIDYWYGLEAEVVRIARFDGLKHPHHQRGGVITWLVSD
jgi:hypothetical protein